MESSAMMTLPQTIQTKKGAVKLPCLDVQIVPIDQVQANNYNPNSVSSQNMTLLEESILSNGFCFAVVTVWDPDAEKYVIVDGFHRYLIFRDYLEAKELPIIVLDHDISQRMAATVQFNRARGVHQVELMGDLVKALVEQGLPDEEIAKRLGMEAEEVYRLKQITGIAELFKNQIYSKAWEMVEVADDV
jgi:ParB-like chromosome segregation protein Spo0J